MNQDPAYVRLGPLGVERTFAVKTYDIDFAGHVSNIVYIRWLEDLRLALLDEYFPLDVSMSEGVAPLLTSTAIDYRSPVRLFDQVVGQLWATEIGVVRMVLAARFMVGDRLCAEAVQRGTYASMQTGTPVRVPAGLREIFVAHQHGE